MIQKATLQIKDAGNHLLATSGCIFVVISKKNEVSGVVTRTHQQVYVSEKVEGLGSYCPLTQVTTVPMLEMKPGSHIRRHWFAAIE